MTQTTAQPSALAPTSKLLEALDHIGGIAVLATRTAAAVFRRPFGFGEILRQIEVIGLKSLAVAVLTAVFSSLVMTVQFGVQLVRFGAVEHIGNAVALAQVRELGPVLTALMVGGRVGAGIAAELGSMTVTEQVDAMRAMGADPIKKLVVPRVAAAVIVLPLLTAIAIVLGIFAAMIVAGLRYNISPAYFQSSIVFTVTLDDFIGGITKTLFFGLFLSLIACHQGLSTQGGTEGVGRATTRTVVITSIVTLISDFVLTSVLLRAGF